MIIMASLHILIKMGCFSISYPPTAPTSALQFKIFVIVVVVVVEGGQFFARTNDFFLNFKSELIFFGFREDFQ